MAKRYRKRASKRYRKKKFYRKAKMAIRAIRYDNKIRITCTVIDTITPDDSLLNDVDSRYTDVMWLDNIGASGKMTYTFSNEWKNVALIY